MIFVWEVTLFFVRKYWYIVGLGTWSLIRGILAHISKKPQSNPLITASILQYINKPAEKSSRPESHESASLGMRTSVSVYLAYVCISIFKFYWFPTVPFLGHYFLTFPGECVGVGKCAFPKFEDRNCAPIFNNDCEIMYTLTKKG